MTAADRHPALELRGLGVRYPGSRGPALENVDLVVQAGQLVGVAGRNGAGKSSLALAAAGLIPRVVRATLSGGARIGGRDGGAMDPGDLVERVGIVFSSPSSQLSGAKRTVREELAFGLENLGVARGDMDARIDRAMAELGIGHLAGRPPAALSGGEQQRLAIASILCLGPGALVLDEPASHLDPAGAEALADLLADRAAAGTAILVAEHRQAVLARTMRIAVLDGGRLVVEAAPAEALGPAVAGPAGVAIPVTLRVAAAIRGDPGLAFDEGRLAEAIRRWAATVTAETITAGTITVGTITAAAAPPAPPPAAWEPVRGQPPAGFSLDRVVHRYPGGVTGLAGVDLAAEPGETVAIVGQNGSGKTTLARHLAGVLVPSAGRVLLGGADIAGRPIAAVARTVGLVFADPDRQLFSRTVEAEVAFGPRNLGLSPGSTLRLVDQALRLAGLHDRRASNPHDLVGPERRLVAIASVLAMDPALLVLDEPTTGQDAPGMARVGAIVDAFAGAGRTVVAVTHDLEFAARHFRRIVVMQAGRIVDDGPPEMVLAAAGPAPLATGGLASGGLEPPAIARLAARLGLGGPVPLTVEGLLRRAATLHGTAAGFPPAAAGGGDPPLDSHPA